jgi:hypothetical protein
MKLNLETHMQNIFHGSDYEEYSLLDCNAM